ncbi:nucleolar and coiled-body phosphoprotein 1 isoform X1 [Halyomorpha halys]|uniref:nucleolar and coiled-body phosphoprotein 1 isoform X1 n=1 Tax=Halyomorpha halys TaxID=286706 RepID=UPI0006D4DF59|nr:nucleolar and coiled-body phosphoprotein 1 isoform X1 [Halyomorpha halys]
MDGAHCTPSPEEENCQSTAFTVTFESAKAANNRFIKRHIRNLSLPVVKVYDNKVGTPPVFNGNETGKKPGNHSEGYFSSDAEDDHGVSKMSFLKHENSPTKEEESSNEEEERSEGAPSEAGTYTIDKESPEVVTARLSIDAKFGVKQKENQDSKEWVSDWALKTSNLPGPSAANSLSSKTKANLVSKIPSPITPRARLGSRSKKIVPAKPIERSRPNSPNVAMSKEDPLTENDTERYLKTTERAMSVLAARMSLSLDSGGESDNGETPRRGRPLQRSDSSASESHHSRQAGTSSTRYNRAFSLRRGRLDDGTTTKKIESAPVKPISPRVVQPPRVKPSVTPPAQNNLSRNDITRTSMRSAVSQRSPQLSTPKQDFGRKKIGVPGATGGRSNSSLSSKEVEFQNWKRRKSYDPMKAAAEGKRKEAAAKRSGASPNVMSQSSTNATTTPKSPVNSVLRSASFHTTRQLGGPSQSSSEEEEEEEEEEETTLSAEDWPPKLPNALEQENNVPGGSRGSLYSNNSSGGSPHHRPRLEGVDNFIVSAIATISSRVNINTALILKKLRFLFDEESDKYKDLSSELELLEASIEPSTSPNKSTSRDLAITLKNLKRLDSAVKVLNEVLFENVEYQ